MTGMGLEAFCSPQSQEAPVPSGVHLLGLFLSQKVSPSPLFSLLDMGWAAKANKPASAWLTFTNSN